MYYINYIQYFNFNDLQLEYNIKTISERKHKRNYYTLNFRCKIFCIVIFAQFFASKGFSLDF